MARSQHHAVAKPHTAQCVNRSYTNTQNLGKECGCTLCCFIQHSNRTLGQGTGITETHRLQSWKLAVHHQGSSRLQARLGPDSTCLLWLYQGGGGQASSTAPANTTTLGRALTQPHRSSGAGSTASVVRSPRSPGHHEDPLRRAEGAWAWVVRPGERLTRDCKGSTGWVHGEAGTPGSVDRVGSVNRRRTAQMCS